MALTIKIAMIVKTHCAPPPLPQLLDTGTWYLVEFYMLTLNHMGSPLVFPPDRKGVLLHLPSH